MLATAICGNAHFAMSVSVHRGSFAPQHFRHCSLCRFESAHAQLRAFGLLQKGT